jgi:hypothetical protein
VRYFTGRFHAKIYVFDEAALIGSSNLTDGGLCSNREATLLVEDSESIDEARRLFAELWESARTLTPDKLKAFGKAHVPPSFPEGHPRYAEAVGGKVEPPNIQVNDGQPKAARMFIEQLRRQVYEQYRPAFTEVVETLRQENYRRADLEGPHKYIPIVIIMTFHGTRLPPCHLVSISCLPAPYFHGGNMGSTRRKFLCKPADEQHPHRSLKRATSS